MEIEKNIKPFYYKWAEFMDKNIKFSLKTSEFHTKKHCRNVLLFSLLIADLKQLADKEKEILSICSVFHDSKRHDDGYDIGHGKRAADYYKKYCNDNIFNYEALCYEIIAYHDRDDNIGIENITNKFTNYKNAVLLYSIFKDADALDRF